MGVARHFSRDVYELALGMQVCNSNKTYIGPSSLSANTAYIEQFGSLGLFGGY